MSNPSKLPSKVYKAIITTCDRYVPDKLKPLWNHEAGPKTIFFWAPTFKWGLVIAGLGDINRPVEKLSVRQCASLSLSGFIWSRYSLVIKPRIWSLFAVNFLVGFINTIQLGRAYKYQYDKQNAEKAKQNKKP